MPSSEQERVGENAMVSNLAAAVAGLEARAAICELKARYFRVVDSKEWASLRALFVSDATFTVRGLSLEGPGAIVDWIRGNIHDAVTVHHGHMPEISVDGHLAIARWTLYDILEWPDGTGFHGSGYYNDSYRLEHRWKIASSKLVRVRIEPLPGGLPSRLPPPPELAG